MAEWKETASIDEHPPLAQRSTPRDSTVRKLSGLEPGQLVASLFLVAMLGAPSSVLVPSSDARSP